MNYKWHHLSTIGIFVALIAAVPPAAAQEKTGVIEEEEAVKPPTNPDKPPATNTAPEAAPAKERGANREVEEEIVVTGSRVRRKDLTTPAPITILTRDQIQASGKASIGDFLQTMPEQGNATNTSVNNGGTAPPASTCAASAPPARWCCSTAAAFPPRARAPTPPST